MRYHPIARPKYSVCITSFNCVQSIGKSLTSLLNQLNPVFEVIIVDNFSTDGSYPILKSYEREGRVTLIQSKCSRGLGREIAFENSAGEYVISNMDMDDVFSPQLNGLLETYHRSHEGRLLRVTWKGMGAITVAPRILLAALGGWRDLDYFEDVDLWNRARKFDVYDAIEFPIFSEFRDHSERRSFLGKAEYSYLTNRERIRLGVFPRRKYLSTGLPIFLLSWVGATLRGRIRDNVRSDLD